MHKIFSKVLATLMIIFIGIHTMNFFSTASATEIGDTTYLKRGEQGFLSIQKWTGSYWTYVVHSITNYVDEQGIERVAYCVNPDLVGIGYIDGESEGYNVKLKELLSDQRLWRVYTNGYPYKSPADLGVENEEDAYLATKQAAYCIIRGYSIDEIKQLYRAGKDPVAGENVEDIQRRGEKIIDAMCMLVNVGYNGTETMQTNNLLEIKQVGEPSIDSSNKEYYSQNYKVESSVDFEAYKIRSISNFPEGTYVADIDGNIKTEFVKNEIFKIMIPQKNIFENISGDVEVTADCKNYPIYYAECENGNNQNYILCCDTYSKNIIAKANFDINVYNSKLVIHKVDKDTNIPIANVKFLVKYESGEEIGVYFTNEEGIIEIDKLKPGKVLAEEIESDIRYTIDTEAKNIKLGFNDFKTIEVKNELKKGSIKIIKVDSNNIETRIPNVKFEVYNNKKELVATVITDNNGEALVENLPTESLYTIKEVETAEEYELNNEEVTITLEEGQIKTLTFKNQKKKAGQEKLPRTGKISYERYLLAVILAFFAVKNKIIKKFVK